MAVTIPLVQARAGRRQRLKPVHLAFLGCGFITRVHSRHLRKMPSEFVCSYASRDPARAAEYQRRHGGLQHYTGYDEALRDPTVDAVVVAVPPHLHLELALRALELGKHVVVEKPAFSQLDDYRIAIEAREQAGRVVLVAENDHYKPLAVALRRLLDSRDAIDVVRRSSRNKGGVIGELVFGQFVSVMRKPKSASDWRMTKPSLEVTRSSKKAFTGYIWPGVSAPKFAVSMAISRDRLTSHSRVTEGARACSLHFSMTTVLQVLCIIRARFQHCSGDLACRSFSGERELSRLNQMALSLLCAVLDSHD